MKCIDCKFCILEDYGYSNWTVEGTNANCLLELNPGYPTDSWYGEAEEHDFANVCPRFKEGPAIEVDVENEQGDLYHYAQDPEVKEILEKDYLWKLLTDE